jgi:hypothetical protein
MNSNAVYLFTMGWNVCFKPFLVHILLNPIILELFLPRTLNNNVSSRRYSHYGYFCLQLCTRDLRTLWKMREEGREEEDESDDFTNDSTPQK